MKILDSYAICLSNFIKMLLKNKLRNKQTNNKSYLGTDTDRCCLNLLMGLHVASLDT